MAFEALKTKSNTIKPTEQMARKIAGVPASQATGTRTTQQNTADAAAIGGTSSLKDAYTQRQQSSQNQINRLYDQQLASKQQGLKTEYDRNLSDAQAAMAKIAPQYRTQANSLAADYERSRRNANMNALNSGLNSGTRVQQQNALNSSYIQNYNDLQNQRAAATTAAQQGITDLKADYLNNLNQARSDVDTSRNKALIEDQQKNQTWYDTQAATLAQYGDFSGYQKLYGKDQANAMKNVWIAQNPVQAFRMGLVDKDQFKKLTGRDITEIGYENTYQRVYDSL